MEKDTFSIVQLDTMKLHQPAKVSVFQFGSVAAPIGSSYLINPTTIPAGLNLVDVFWMNRNIVISVGNVVRFNIRFEIDVHDCIHLQVRLKPSSSNSNYLTDMDWRWAASHGEMSIWTKEGLKTNWTDGDLSPRYFVEIVPNLNGINIQLGKEKE